MLKLCRDESTLNPVCSKLTSHTTSSHPNSKIVRFCFCMPMRSSRRSSLFSFVDHDDDGATPSLSVSSVSSCSTSSHCHHPLHPDNCGHGEWKSPYEAIYCASTKKGSSKSQCQSNHHTKHTSRAYNPDQRSSVLRREAAGLPVDDNKKSPSVTVDPLVFSAPCAMVDFKFCHFNIRKRF
jgi:hypothetical protein